MGGGRGHLVIIPGITASAHGNTGSGGTGSPSNIPTPSDYVGVGFTSNSSQILNISGGGIPGAPISAVATSAITASWVPSTTTNVTGYIATISYTDANGNFQSYQISTTGASVSFTPPILSMTSSYNVTVAAVTANGVTGQASTQVINTTFGYGSAESNNTSANTSSVAVPGTYLQAQINSQAIQSSLTGYTPNFGPKGTFGL